MTPTQARALLGVGPDAEPSELRTAYRRRLLVVHPDVNDASSSTDLTVRLNDAFRLLSETQLSPSGEADAPEQARDPRPRPEARQRPMFAADDAEECSILVHADVPETWRTVVDVADRIGEIGYADRHAGLLEVVVEFTDAPTSSVVLTVEPGSQRRTRVSCAVEPLSGGSAPSDAAVTRLILRTLRGCDPSS